MQPQLAARNELTQFKEEIANMMKNKLGVDMGNTRLYQKPYRADFEYVAFPPGWCMPDFVKFSGDDNRTTWEHISQYTCDNPPRKIPYYRLNQSTLVIKR
jgi:hypothetical protein